MNPIIQVIKMIDTAIPVAWDRFTRNDEGYYVVYGWIARGDGQRDFLMLAMSETDKLEDVFYTTSSAKFSESIERVLFGSAADHNPCRKIEELFDKNQIG